MKTTNSLRVSHRYTRLPDTSFNIFATSVVIAMTDNPAFLNPLVPLAVLSGLQSDFEQKMLASVIGGKITTALKKEARAALTDGLRREGIYVQGASLNLSMLLSSGYSAASQNRAQIPLVRPWVLKILNEDSVSGQLKADRAGHLKSGHFEGRIAFGAADAAQRRDESTQNEPATVHHHVMAARMILSADRTRTAIASGATVFNFGVQS
jgi:hypothetical protein